MSLADEWTFVPRRNSSSNRHHHRHIAKGAARSGNRVGCGGDGGLYGRASASPAGAPKSTTRPRVGGNNRDDEDGSERIKRDVLECIRALEGQLRAGNGFAHRLMMSMTAAVSSSYASRQHAGDGGDGDVHRATKDADAEDANANAASRALHLSDIVAYGIGNFSTERFRSPMLQLACLLLLRRCAASDTSTNEDRSDDRSDADHHRDGFESFKDDQKRVPTHYHDPCILPVEREMLENVFHVHVLEYNDMGKRTLGIESVPCRQQRSSVVDESSLPLSSSTAESSRCRSRCTLFYMPHCPMRLYSNVLWAHWSRIFPPASVDRKGMAASIDECVDLSSRDNDKPIHSLVADDGDADDGPVILFGNSFRNYEERAISSQERNDSTNCVFVIASSDREIHIDVVGNAGKRRGGGGDLIVNDALRHLEVAFSDCSVIYFPLAASRVGDPGDDDDGDDNDDGDDGWTSRTAWPDRPKEWFASMDTNDGGELT